MAYTNALTLCFSWFFSLVLLLWLTHFSICESFIWLGNDDPHASFNVKFVNLLQTITIYCHQRENTEIDRKTNGGKNVTKWKNQSDHSFNECAATRNIQQSTLFPVVNMDVSVFWVVLWCLIIPCNPFVLCGFSNWPTNFNRLILISLILSTEH